MAAYWQSLVLSFAASICTFAVASSCTENSSCFDEPDAQSAVVLSMSLSRASNKLHNFATFVAEYQRTYKKHSEEYEMRHEIFKKRLHQIHRHNKHAKRRWNAAINHLSDRTDAELADLRGLRAVKSRGGVGSAVTSKGTYLDQIQADIVQEERSWVHLDAVKADIDQSACGSCWAVATSVMMRANAEINGYNRTFSAQELVDCTPNPHKCGGTGGCKGSTVELAMNWIMEKGLATATETPYHATDGTCKKASAALIAHGNHGDEEVEGNKGQNLQEMIAVGLHQSLSSSSPGLALGLTSWERLPENEYQPLLHAVATVGPVAVSVGARPWHSYDNGIFDGCGRDAVIDHAVTLVGYGKDAGSGDKYWIIKNSWGNHWGEEGKIRLLRHEGDVHCGTDRQPEVGTACEGGPSEVHVCGMCGILYDAVVPHFQKLL